MSATSDHGRNQKIVSLGIADLGIASIIFLAGSIYTLLFAFKVHVHNPFRLNAIPVIGLFISMGWIFVAWKLIKSSDKEKDIRQRRRYVLYWTCYSTVIAVLNIGAIIWFIVIVAVKDYHLTSYIIGIIISTVIFCVRGFIFFTVFYYSKELLNEHDSSRKYSSFASKIDKEKIDTNNENKRSSGTDQERTVIVTPV